MNRYLIQEYVNNFRTQLSRFLKPNIGLQVESYDCGNEGAVIVVKFNPGGHSEDKYSQKASIADALSGLDQNFIGGNISGVTFKGTNVSMMEDKILFIKDSSPTEWSIQKVHHDVGIITSPPKST